MREDLVESEIITLREDSYHEMDNNIYQDLSCGESDVEQNESEIHPYPYRIPPVVKCCNV